MVEPDGAGDPGPLGDAADRTEGAVDASRSAAEATDPDPNADASARDSNPEDPEAGWSPIEAAETAPSDAFQSLGNEVRMGILRDLLAAEREDGPGTTRTFSELFEASGAERSAGFAYHLRQVTGEYVRKRNDGEYVLTYAGRKVARTVVAGTYTESVDRDPVTVDDDCPLCGQADLRARAADNYVTVACDGCGGELLTLPFPPRGHRDHEDAALTRAFDRHHRHRIALMTDGVCPECAGATDARIERRQADDRDAGSLQLHLSCDGCGHRLRTPVTLGVLDHPAVVSFYRDHGEKIDDRPIWNVGPEWRETLVSAEPFCVRVSTRLGEEVLDLFLDERASVVATRIDDADDRG